MNSCTGCRSHYSEWHWRFFKIDFCGRTGDVVGFECPIGVLETMGCSDYEPPTAWPEGAIA